MTTVGTKYRGTKEYYLTFSALIAAAQCRGVVAYTKVARILGITQPGQHMAKEVGQILGEISEDEHNNGRPMLSTVAVGATGLRPGEGFFILARSLGKLSGTDQNAQEKFWLAECESVYETWRAEY